VRNGALHNWLSSLWLHCAAGARLQRVKDFFDSPLDNKMAVPQANDYPYGEEPRSRRMLAPMVLPWQNRAAGGQPSITVADATATPLSSTWLWMLLRPCAGYVPMEAEIAGGSYEYGKAVRVGIVILMLHAARWRCRLLGPLAVTTPLAAHQPPPLLLVQDKKENFAVCLGPAETPDTRMPTPRWPAGPAGFKVAVTVRARPAHPSAPRCQRPPLPAPPAASTEPHLVIMMPANHDACQS